MGVHAHIQTTQTHKCVSMHVFMWCQGQEVCKPSRISLFSFLITEKWHSTENSQTKLLPLYLYHTIESYKYELV